MEIKNGATKKANCTALAHLPFYMQMDQGRGTSKGSSTATTALPMKAQMDIDSGGGMDPFIVKMAPAVVFKDGSQQWWVNGRTLSSTEYAAWQEKQQEEAKRRQQQLLGVIDSLKDGTTEPVSILPKIKILKPPK